MVDFDKYKEDKERERKEKLNEVLDRYDKEIKYHGSLLDKAELIMKNGGKPSHELIDEIFDAMLKLNSTNKEMHALTDKDEKTGLDLIAEGAYEMMEESKPHIVK